MAAVTNESDTSDIRLMSRSTRIGSAITLFWLAFMIWMIIDDWTKAQALGLNEWGDVFAGFFAPLAFLWLVLGFLQQGTELRISSNALQLQAQELSASVQQQQEMVRVAQQSYDADLELYLRQRAADPTSIEPLFVFNQIEKAVTAANGGVTIPLVIANQGGTATALRFKFDATLPEVPLDELPVLARGAEHAFGLTVPKGLSSISMTVSYADARGSRSERRFQINLQSDPDSQVRVVRSGIRLCM